MYTMAKTNIINHNLVPVACVHTRGVSAVQGPV